MGTLSRSVPVGAVAKAVDRIERGGDLAQCRAQALQQALAGFRRRDAAGRAVEQPHAEPGLQPAQGLAQGGGRDPAQAGHAAKAPRARHRREGFEIGEIDIAHCSKIQTACSFMPDYRTNRNAGMIHRGDACAHATCRRNQEIIDATSPTWDQPAPPFPPSASAAWACRACTGRPTGRESIATIHAALDAGITLLDTGDFYGMGHNEMLIGEALQGRDRDRVR